MKQIFKKTSIAMLSVITLMSAPVQVLALSGPSDGLSSAKIQDIDAARQKKEADLSAKLTEVCSKYAGTRMGTSLGEKKDELSTKLHSKETDLATKRTEWDTKRTEARSLADTKRQEHYAKLLEQATTDSQKAAVATFQASVEKAVADRRTSQDAARETYRNGVDAALADRKKALETAASDFKLQVDAALTKAKTSCQNGTPLDAVKVTLKSDLEAAKDSLKSANDSLPKISDTVKVLAEDRKNALDDAKAEFEKALDAAKATLKAALSQGTSASDDPQNP